MHILPIFFIVTMFLVQYLTPSPGDRSGTAEMMAFTMPAFFGFMTWNMGSGLALYWAVSNIINVTASDDEPYQDRQAVRDIAAKRAAKRLAKK